MPTQDIQYVLDAFPKLAVDGWKKTSEETPDYNCFAFALHDEDDWYSPLPLNGYYWPAGSFKAKRMRCAINNAVR